MLKQGAKLSIAVAACVVMSACANGGSSGSGGSGGGTSPVTLDIVSELSGSGALSGTDWKNGVETAVADINKAGGILNHKVVTKSYDTATDPATSVSAMRKAVSDSPMAVLGTVYSSSTIANMKILQNAGIPQVTGSRGASIFQQGNDNIFASSFDADQSFGEVVELLKQKHVKKLAFIYADDEYGQGGRVALKPLLGPAGISLTQDIATKVGQVDFTPEISRISSSGADAIFIYVHQDEAARLVQQLASTGLKNKIPVVGDATVLGADTLKLAGSAADGIEGVVDFASDAKPFAPLKAEYQKRYNSAAPSTSFFTSYVATWLLKYAAEKAGSVDPAKVKAALHGQTFCLAKAPKLFASEHVNKAGTIDRESFVVTAQNGKAGVTGQLGPLNASDFKSCH